MKLYYHPVSGYSQKVAMAFYEKGQSFTPHVVNLLDQQANAEYRELHPLGKIPLLDVDDGEIVWESTIIIEYIDTQFDTGTRLIPEDKKAARRARFFDRMSDQYVLNPVSTIFIDPLRPESERDPRAVERAQKTLSIMFPMMDEALGQNQWALGDTFSIAECAIAPALAYAKTLHPYHQFRNLTAYAERIHARPSWQRVWSEAAPYFPKG